MPKSVLRKTLQGFQPYIPGEQPPDGEGWVKLNTNESPLPPSPKVIEAIKAAATDALRLYPSPTAAPARKAIARHFGLDPRQVAVGNGGDELIELCFRAFADAGDRVAFPTPTYPLLEPLCRIHEAIPSAHATELPWELPASLGPDPAPLKFIVNPNSPTGALFDMADVESVVAASSGMVAIDEAYVDFAPHSALPLLKHHENVLLLRTFSKSYGLAGLQIVQGNGFVAILQEMIHDVRMIPTDGRPHLPSDVHQWLGDSRGHWEGNTLVVDTTNFTDKTAFQRSSEHLHVIERITRVGDNTIQYEFTAEDPHTWAEPWSAKTFWTKLDTPIYEYACQEGNYGMHNNLSGQRAMERKAAEEAAKKGSK